MKVSVEEVGYSRGKRGERWVALSLGVVDQAQGVTFQCDQIEIPFTVEYPHSPSAAGRRS